MQIRTASIPDCPSVPPPRPPPLAMAVGHRLSLAPRNGEAPQRAAKPPTRHPSGPFNLYLSLSFRYTAGRTGMCRQGGAAARARVRHASAPTLRSWSDAPCAPAARWQRRGDARLVIYARIRS